MPIESLASMELKQTMEFFVQENALQNVIFKMILYLSFHIGAQGMTTIVTCDINHVTLIPQISIIFSQITDHSNVYIIQANI